MCFAVCACEPCAPKVPARYSAAVIMARHNSAVKRNVVLSVHALLPRAEVGINYYVICIIIIALTN